MQSLSFPFHQTIEPSLFQLLFDDLLKLKANIEFSSFGISFKLPKPCSFEKDAKQLQTELIKAFQAETKTVLDFQSPDVSFLVDFEWNRIELTLFPVYISGFYNKVSRELPQTIHYCFDCKGAGCMTCQFTGRASKESIQELLEKTLFPVFQATESKFHGAGREDKNVRMLGTGRQFVVELLNAKKRNIELSDIENKINSNNFEKFSVHDLEFCSKETVAKIKSEMNEKVYSAKVQSSSIIDSKKLNNMIGETFSIKQQTPTRSEKSRSQLERKHSVMIQSASKLNEKEFNIEMICSHGMYVKEFISGDDNRTIPSLSSLLGIPCQCIELDVQQILPSSSSKLKI